MSDLPEFTDLLDSYLEWSRKRHQWKPVPKSISYREADKHYQEARTALNEYMNFMRSRVHTHPDIGLDGLKTDI